MLLHFPSALFPLDLACSLAADHVWPEPLLHCSALCLLSGTILGWLAAVAGAADLGGVTKRKPGSVKKALLHGAINLTVLVAYSVLCFLLVKQLPAFTKDSGNVRLLKACLVTLMIAGNYIGGSLVLKDKVLDES